MELAIVDLGKLRLAQAATEGPWKPDSIYPASHHVIRLEPSGTAVATNFKAMVVAELAVAPFEGEPRYLMIDGTVPKAAKTGVLTDEKLTTDKGELGVRWLTKRTEPAVKSYYDYEPTLARVSEAVEHPRGDYEWNHKLLHRLIQASPNWPRQEYIRLRHLSEMSVVIDLGVEGATVMLALAKKER